MKISLWVLKVLILNIEIKHIHKSILYIKLGCHCKFSSLIAKNYWVDTKKVSVFWIQNQLQNSWKRDDILQNGREIQTF
jgi:hypothetical protein